MAGPLIVDIKRSSFDDGPGIRSVVFFKGCPLRCVWCQNPAAMSAAPQLVRTSASCIGCRRCEQSCPQQRARPAGERESAATRCRACGACVRACPASARRVAGEVIAIDDLVEQLLDDEPFFRRSGGGVTLSGGEPTLFPEAAGKLAARLRERGVHVLLETCGHFDWTAFAERMLPHLGAIYFDLKLADPREHQRRCGRGNAVIHDNLRRLLDAGVEVLPRVPLVPEITDTEENLRGIGALLLQIGCRQVALLPYNPLWVEHRRSLGMELPYAHDQWMSDEAVQQRAELLRSAGLQVVS